MSIRHVGVLYGFRIRRLTSRSQCVRDPINTKRHGNLFGKKIGRCLSKFLTPVKKEKDAYRYRKVGSGSREGKPRQLNRTPPLAYLLPGIFLVNLFSSPHPMSFLIIRDAGIRGHNTVLCPDVFPIPTRTGFQSRYRAAESR